MRDGFHVCKSHFRREKENVYVGQPLPEVQRFGQALDIIAEMAKDDDFMEKLTGLVNSTNITKEID